MDVLVNFSPLPSTWLPFRFTFDSDTACFHRLLPFIASIFGVGVWPFFSTGCVYTVHTGILYVLHMHVISCHSPLHNLFIHVHIVVFFQAIASIMFTWLAVLVQSFALFRCHVLSPLLSFTLFSPPLPPSLPLTLLLLCSCGWCYLFSLCAFTLRATLVLVWLKSATLLCLLVHWVAQRNNRLSKYLWYDSIQTEKNL